MFHIKRKEKCTVSESGLSSVMKRLVKAVMVFICAAAGYQISKLILERSWWPNVTLIHPIGTTVFIILLFWLGLTKFGQFSEAKLQNTSVSDLIVSLMGLILGLMLANLIALPMSRIPGGVGVYIAAGE